MFPQKKSAMPKSRHCSHLSRHLGLQGAHSAVERARYHFRGCITAADPPNLERANALTKVCTKHLLRRTSVSPPNASASLRSCNRRKLVNLVEGVDEKVGGNGRFNDCDRFARLDETEQEWIYTCNCKNRATTSTRL